MRKMLAFIVLAGLLAGCSWWGRTPNINNEEAISTVQQFSEKMKYEKALFLEDSVVYYETAIHRFRLDFSTQAILTLPEARELIVDVADDFLSFLNGNPELMFARGEFTECDLEIYINAQSFYGYYNDVNRVGLITLRNGISHFFSFATLDPDRDHWKKREEFFWQSRAIVEAQREGREAFKPAPEKKRQVLQEEWFNPEEYYKSL